MFWESFPRPTLTGVSCEGGFLPDFFFESEGNPPIDCPELVGAAAADASIAPWVGGMKEKSKAVAQKKFNLFICSADDDMTGEPGNML